MITIDKYGQSVKVYDGIVNMYFEAEPIKRGVSIVIATGMVSILEFVEAHYTAFIINGVPVTTINEFTVQFALAIPAEGGSGGSQNIDEVLAEGGAFTDDRSIDIANKSLSFPTYQHPGQGMMGVSDEVAFIGNRQDGVNGTYAEVDNTTQIATVVANNGMKLNGNKIWLSNYQNSAMSAPVLAYVFTDSDGNIFEVYEPTRNNRFSRRQYSYANSIELFPFDNVNHYGNTINDVSILNLASDALIRNNDLRAIVIKAADKTGFELIGNAMKGNYGAGSPNDAEIFLSGNNVTIIGNSAICAQSFNNSGAAFYFDSIGSDSIIYGAFLKGVNYFDFGGHKGIIRRTAFSVNTQVTISNDAGECLDMELLSNTGLDLADYINDVQLNMGCFIPVTDNTITASTFMSFGGDTFKLDQAAGAVTATPV